MKAKPLAGIKIIDFSAVVAGPICSRLLCDCGADVVKVESSKGGDMLRGPTGYSRVFANFNAGKKSIALDLKKHEAQSIARDLIKDADVVIENFRPGVMKRFNLDYESLREEYPGLVYCSISGFGQQGPFAQRSAYAPIAHAASGFDEAFMATQRDKNAPPPDSGIMFADILAGSYAFGAIQTALLGRVGSGRGEFIDVSMMESMMSLIPREIQAIQNNSTLRGGGFPPVKVRDGYVMICIISEKNMRELAEVIDRPDMLSDERFSTRLNRYRNIFEFVTQIEKWTKNLTAYECEQKLSEAGVPCSVYNTATDMLSHPQVTARGSFAQLEDDDGPFLIQNGPFQFTGVSTSTSSDVAALGQHSVDILQNDLGYATEKIDQLVKSGVVLTQSTNK